MEKEIENLQDEEMEIPEKKYKLSCNILEKVNISRHEKEFTDIILRAGDIK